MFAFTIIIHFYYVFKNFGVHLFSGGALFCSGCREPVMRTRELAQQKHAGLQFRGLAVRDHGVTGLASQGCSPWLAGGCLLPVSSCGHPVLLCKATSRM